MLKSKFSRTRDSFKAQRIFTDRVEPRAAFLESVQSIEARPQEILVYYGKGGIGKSRLLKDLYTGSDQAYAPVSQRIFHNIFVSLDAYDFANPVNILTAIRNGINGDCGLFDYALLQYCAKAKMTVDEILSKNSILSSPVMDVLNDIINLSTASVCIPTAALSKCVSLVKDLRFRARHRDVIDEIAQLNEFEIFERLPHYLGMCISYAAEKGHVHVLFLDSYESLLARTARGTPSVEREEWLRELLASSEVLRIIIASRERLLWDKTDPEWTQYLNQHLLHNLSDEDSRWFLSQVPITDPAITEAIVGKAGGVPLYLDLCVDIYEAGANDGAVFDVTSLPKGEKMIDHYIRHLSDKDMSAVKILSIPKYFSGSFAMELLKRENLIYSADELQSLLERSIILPLEAQRDLWKVDESVRLHLNAYMGRDRKTGILGNILNCVILQPAGCNYPYLKSVLELICEEPACMEGICEKCVQAVDHYANMGFWNEIHSVLSPEISGENVYLHTLAVFSELIRLRRIGQLQKAETLGERYPLEQSTLGVWYYMYRYLRIQIRHLLGHYDESILAYQALAKEMGLIRARIPGHIYNTVCMKYADLLFLKGQFDDSLAIVENLLQGADTSTEDQIELFRIKGHIYRFRRQYPQARIIYSSALQMAQEHDLRAFRGKLFTNMTEVSCVENPEEALAWFEKAREENETCDNGIELGKAFAAASAAYTALGDTDQGVAMARQAIAAAEKSGYQSGRAFGLAALHYALAQAGKEADAAQVKQQLAQQIKQIGVYQYLLERVQ